MGVWLTKNYIEIAEKSFNNGVLVHYGYKDIDDAFINDVVSDTKIQVIQISESLPDKAYQTIDSIMAKRPELIFRIYGLLDESCFDISFLERMSHLENLRIDCHLREHPELINFNTLTKLNLKSLHLNAFDLKDYSFVQTLSPKLEKLVIHADAMGGAVNFDCRWLLRYENLTTLWLGKKAKKNINCLSQVTSLKSLSLRGIKLTSFAFLKQMKLEKFELLWNSNNELSELSDLKSLREIGLWRINKLDNITFISELENLEVIKLQDLKHVTQLPDLSKLKRLRKIVLDNTGISIDGLDDPIRSIVEEKWR